MHNNHKIIKLSDIESLKEQNIFFDSTKNDFNKSHQKLIDLKNKIENEIDKINNLYEKTMDDITKSFLKKYEKLLEEEKNIKEKLDNEVTKIKEKLEEFLSELKNCILINNRIIKGIKNFENEEKNKIIILSYISKMNKIQKNMTKLNSKIMKNIKFFYEEEKNNIKYEEYCFNGIHIPTKFEIEDITPTNLKIYLKNDDINLINIEKNQIKYRIEMRKENDNFENIYEGNNNYYLINNLTSNSKYEFRICTIYNDCISSWSEIQKIKTLICNSIILSESNRKDEFLEKISEWVGYKKMELIFRGTRDGLNNKNFHNKCDNQGETITLCRNNKGNIFGGYSSISWAIDYKNGGTFYSSPNSFLFTLSNIYNTIPTKFLSKKDGNEIYQHDDFGPRFGKGHDLVINFDKPISKSWTKFPNTYQDSLGKGRSIFTGDFNNNNEYIILNEIEIFKLLNIK